MEDAADAVVPLRPGFDVGFRGFQREQVLEHLEVLENQLELVTIDRNEAARLNSDLRELYDRTRQELTETQQRLRHVESSDTGLPAASQRVQEMLALAEEELRTIREQAGHEAEVIRSSAESEANRLIEQAENTAGELHGQCEQLLAEIERRHDRLHRDRARQLNELRAREQRMRRSVRDAYKSLMDSARREAAELVERTRRECGEREAEAERHRRETLEEITRHRSELEKLRDHVLNTLDTASDTIGASAVSLRGTPEHQEAPDRGSPEQESPGGRPRSRVPRPSESEPGDSEPSESEVREKDHRENDAPEPERHHEELDAASGTDGDRDTGGGTRFLTAPASVPVQAKPFDPLGVGRGRNLPEDVPAGTDGSATERRVAAPEPRRPDPEQSEAAGDGEDEITTVSGSAQARPDGQDAAERN